MKIAAVLWGVWFARNKLICENKRMTPAVTMNCSRQHIADWREVNKRKVQRSMNSRANEQQHHQLWLHPDVGEFKLNVNASVFEGDDSFAVGMVLRDHRGDYIIGKTMRFSGQVSVIEAELVGVLEGLLWSDELNCGVTTVESDSKLSVEAINKDGVNLLELGSLINHCRSIIGSNGRILVGFVRKRANRVAHSMARILCERNSFVINSSPPSCVLGTLLSDCLKI